MTFDQSLVYFQDGGHVMWMFCLGAGGYFLSRNTKIGWQAFALIYVGSYMVSQWALQNIWQRDMWWMYFFSSGFILQKLRITALSSLVEGSLDFIFSLSNKPQKATPNPERHFSTSSRSEQFREQENAFEQRQKQREEFYSESPDTEDPVDSEPEEEPLKDTSPEMPPPRPWWEVLEISPTATREEIERAKKKMSKRYHPDKFSFLGDEVRQIAETKMKEVNRAYEEALS